MKIYSLHLWGKADEWVTNEQSKQATNLFEKFKIIVHNGAHVIPDRNKGICKEICQFILKSQNLSN